MDIFGGFDDDLFEKKKEKCLPDNCYTAQYCEPLWFYELDVSQPELPEDIINALKYKAEYLFMKNKFAEAAECYRMLEPLILNSSYLMKRETYEGLARSLIEIEQLNDSLSYSLLLHSSSNTVDQLTVSLSVLFDVHMLLMNFKDAVSAAQMLANLQSHNSDVWLKLAYSYMCYYNINLPNIPSLFNSQLGKLHKQIKINDKLSTKSVLFDNPRHKKIVGACLFRSLLLLKSVQGTNCGFSIKFNSKYQNVINDDIELLKLPKNFTELVNEKMFGMFFVDNRKDDDRDSSKVFINRESSSESSINSETSSEPFVDRQSSKFSQESKLLNESELSIPWNVFENKWFAWIN